MLALQLQERCFDLLVVAIVLGGMVQGSRLGLFRSIVTGLAAVAAVFVPLAVGNQLSRGLASLDVPPQIAPVATVLGLFIAASLAMRWLARRLIAADAMRLPPVVDLVGGSLVGAVTGTVVAGGLLVGCSILAVPPAVRGDPVEMTFDAGSVMLHAFARCIEPDAETRRVLLQGEPWAKGPIRAARAADANDAVPPRDRLRVGECWASEPFVDANRNGSHDDGEAYLDTDGNRIFSPRLLFDDVNADGRRDIGILERYRLGEWHLVSQSSADPAEDRGAVGHKADDDAP